MLTERQEAILDFIRQYQRDEHVPPSSRIIQTRFGFKSQSTVAQHLKALAKKEQVEQFTDGRWGIKASGVQTHLFEAPVYGAIPAGLPAMQEQEPEETIAVDPAIFGVHRAKLNHFWFLRVMGDSMIGARIFDGDLVALVRRDPRPGEIIAALVDETTTTLKRYLKQRGRTLLHAENPRYPDIVPSRLECQGVVVGVIRRKIA